MMAITRQSIIERAQSGVAVHVRFDQSWSGDTVYISVRSSFADGDSFIAVSRKIWRHALRLKLRPAFSHYALAFECRSKRDLTRADQLVRYINGRRLTKTARNNYGRRNAYR